MYRAIFCLCGLMIWTALAAAGQPSAMVQPVQPQPPAGLSNPAYRAQVAAAAGQPEPLPRQSERLMLSSRAPDGYVGPKEVQVGGLRVDCPNSVPEGEPICSAGYDDTFNSGCNADNPPYPFSPIRCGQRILGTSGTFLFNGNNYRDTDWYEITVTAPTEFTWRVVADFDVLIFEPIDLS